MPDIEKKSISATQAPALFDASPYLTRWMLYRWFKFGEGEHSKEDNRMDWGKRMEPLCLAAAAEDLYFEVRPTRRADGTQPYVRKGLLGCTRDAEIICPDRGPGALETKCAFDDAVWMRDWNGGKKPPRQHEIQLQVQMLVGDGVTSFKWGVLAAWRAGEMKYYERKPMPDLWQALELEAAQFFADLEAEREPDPFGAPIERPLLAEAFPTVIGNPLDLSKFTPGSTEYIEALRVAEEVRLLIWHSAERLGHERSEKALKAKMLGLAKSHDLVLLPNGINFKVTQSPRAGHVVPPSIATSVKPYAPADLETGGIDDFKNADLGG